MRILTPSEQREIEQLKAEVAKLDSGGYDLHLILTDREKWLNILDIVLNANEAMRVAWRQSSNPNINLVQIVTRAMDD